MSHHVSAAEAQYQYDDGEYHGCSVGSVLNILLRGAQLEEHAQWEGSCLLVQSMRNMIGESCRKHQHTSSVISCSMPGCFSSAFTRVSPREMLISSFSVRVTLIGAYASSRCSSTKSMLFTVLSVPDGNTLILSPDG